MSDMKNTNQTPKHVNYNAFVEDGVLQTITRELPTNVIERLATHGKWAGHQNTIELARLANQNVPVLKTHDPTGERLDVVEYHPAYHALMRRAVAEGLHCSIWDNKNNEEKNNRNLVRAVKFMMTSGIEAGHTCPITMTNAAVAVFMTDNNLLSQWQDKILSRNYDSSHNYYDKKNGVTIGMGMTERQGGSDVRANTTTAIKSDNTGGGTDGGDWRVNGQKWFFSAPMCDAFFVLAQTEKGLSCLLVPRLREDNTNNGLNFQRLKDKIGNKANASSEVNFVNAEAKLVGEEGEGVRTILEMVTLTRLDCAVGSAGQMRVALAEAVHHARHRTAFGKKLINQKLMTRVLADMSLDVAAAQMLTLRLAKSFDKAPEDQTEAAYARLMTPAIKFLVCKMSTALVTEAIECLGGNGYVEENILARLFRESPLNAIWEGSGNIMCLDVLRAMRRSPQIVDAVMSKINDDIGGSPSEAIDVLKLAANVAIEDEGAARIFCEQLAITAAAAELKRTMPQEISDAFIQTRLGRPWRYTYGMIDNRFNADAIVEFICPSV